MYMAPEVIENGAISKKSDVYSFGILLYEIVTDSFPYPELESGEITYYKFVRRVVSENYRPQFKVPVKNSIKKLIEKCWSKDPQERPSFEDIFNKLAYNFTDSIFDQGDDDDDENEYYLDDVDVDEVITYADSIQIVEKSGQLDEVLKKFKLLEKSIMPMMKENEKIKKENEAIKKENLKMKNKMNEINNDITELKEKNNRLIKENKGIKAELKNIIKAIDPLKEENEDLKKQISDISKMINENLEERVIEKKDSKIKSFIDYDINKISIKEFNSMPLQNQQSCISKILSKKDKINDFFTSTNSILQYFIKFAPTDATSYFKILTNDIDDDDDDKLLLTVNKNNMIRILSNAINLLFEKKQLSNSSEFANILEEFKFVSMEIKYPIKYFESVLTIISTFKISQEIEINVFITNIDKIDSVFQNSRNITSFCIDFSVSRIENKAFEGSSLEKITIPESVSYIGSRAFYQCASLKEIQIPCSISEINNDTFNGCSSLTKITIPASVKKTGYNCFKGITNLEISGSIQHIPDKAFYQCSSLTQITLPSSVQSIGNEAFNSCNSLRQIKIPSSVKTIGYNCFNGITNLEISGNIQHIPDKAFYQCTSLTQITLPSSVQTIGNSAFNSCNSLKQITIPSSVQTIGDFVFIGCKSLAQIAIPASIKKIGKSCFDGDLHLLSDMENIPNNFFEFSLFRTITIPSTIKTIGNSAFYQCKNLQSMTIPESVINIGENCFSNCSKLSSINFKSSSTRIKYNSFENCDNLYNFQISSSRLKFDSNSKLSIVNGYQGELQCVICSLIRSAYRNSMKSNSNNQYDFGYKQRTSANIQGNQKTTININDIEKTLSILMYISKMLNKSFEGTCEFSYITVSNMIYINSKVISILYSTKDFNFSVFNYNKVVLTIERSTRYCDEILALLKERYHNIQVKII